MMCFISEHRGGEWGKDESWLLGFLGQILGNHFLKLAIMDTQIF